MLQVLSIKNFAIIDDLTIDFSPGLTILSGETGAGKSIIIHALNLLLGSRATYQFIRNGAETAQLEALFLISDDSQVAQIMNQYSYEHDQRLLIRRIISRSGNNKIYVNGQLATIQFLNLITENLASISGQHAHQGLLKEEQQLLILDQFGGCIPLRTRVQACVREIQPLIKERDQLVALKDRQAEQISLLEFQKKEIADAAIELDEITVLEKERIRLKNGEALYTAIYESIQALYDDQGAVVERLSDVEKVLEKAHRIDADLIDKTKKISEATYLIEDITEDLRTYLENIRIDPNRLEIVEERLDILRKLKRKYGGSLAAVQSYFKSIDRRLKDVEDIVDKITHMETTLSRMHQTLVRDADTLSKKRLSAAKQLGEKVETGLRALNMDRTVFKISLEKTPAESEHSHYLTFHGMAINETGLDKIVFLIAPNVGETLKSMAAIASGGELSRIILALKAILANTDAVETVVFDEVDAGIGGRTAEVVGKKLASLSRSRQVICITHLPQIAKFGDHHFRISKHVRGKRTIVSLQPVGKKERIQELARMLGGKTITRTTIEHAREMLDLKD